MWKENEPMRIANCGTKSTNPTEQGDHTTLQSKVIIQIAYELPVHTILKMFGILSLIATSTQGLLLVNGFTTTTSFPLHHNLHASNAAKISSTTLWVQHHHHHIPSTSVLSRHHKVHLDDRDGDDQESPFFASQSAVTPSSSKSVLPPFSEAKTELRLDGLEPYVVVSAITSTTSFGVVTGGNLFVDSPMFSGSDSMFQELLRSLLLLNSTASSLLGLYSLGIFSFTIMYSKAALSRKDGSQELYQNFFDETASIRYKGYRAFVCSLILLVLDLVLFAISYLPESAQPLAAIGSAPLMLACWNDWQTIISSASVIYKKPEDELERLTVEEAGSTPDSTPVVSESEKERTKKSGWVSVTLDKAVGILAGF